MPPNLSAHPACRTGFSEAEEQLLNAKVILRSYNETIARRDPEKSATRAVETAGGCAARPACGGCTLSLPPARLHCASVRFMLSPPPQSHSVKHVFSYPATANNNKSNDPPTHPVLLRNAEKEASEAWHHLQHMLNKEGALVAAEKGKGKAEDGGATAPAQVPVGIVSPGDAQFQCPSCGGAHACWDMGVGLLGHGCWARGTVDSHSFQRPAGPVPAGR